MSIVKSSAMAKPEGLTEDGLAAVIRAEIRSATGFVGGETSESRRQAMERYLGEPYGDEIDGQSRVVSTDIQDAIEDLQPDMMEIFASGDETVKFEPTGSEDVDNAEQATAYCNHIWNADNDGYHITHNWSKDGLLSKVGIVKIYWDESEVTTRHTYTSMGFFELQTLTEEEGVEVLEHSAYPNPQLDPTMVNMLEGPEGEYSDEALMSDGLLHDITITRTKTKGRVKIEGVPPEEFLISRRTTALDNADFTCHKVEKSVSELQEMGFSWEELRDIPSHDEQDFNEERVARFNEDDEWPYDEHSLDPAARKIWIYECYIKVDFDGDGLTEMRHVTTAGPAYRILRNEAVDQHPFVTWSPIKMPHKFFGRSIAEILMDVQRIKTTVLRQWLNNMYKVNNARSAITNKVDIEDYLTNRAGGVVRVDSDAPDAAGHVSPIVTAPLHDYAMPLLEYQDQRREQRTGIIRLNQGMDSKALHDTASGANMIMGAAQRRKLYYARNFAEAMGQAFKKILYLVTTHQDEQRVIRLRGQWVDIDPRVWSAEMDVLPTVGLGHGTKETQIAGLTQVLTVLKDIVMLQGGADGPLVDLGNIYNTVKKLLHTLGFKAHGDYLTDPEDPENQKQPEPPPPDPKLVEVQMKDQLAQKALQMEGERKQAEMQMEHQRKMQEMQLEHSRKLQEIQLDAGLKRSQAVEDAERSLLQAQADAELRGETALEDMRLKRDGATYDMDLRRDNAAADLDFKRSASTAKSGSVSTTETKSKKDKTPVLVVNMPSGKRKISVERDGEGNIVGADVDDG